MQSSGLPTLDDVARRAGVSTATVSRCLNLPDRVRGETRKRVEAAIAELGYMPHFGGRALASNRTNTVGAIIPTMENAIFALGLQALEEELSAAGTTLLVATSHYDLAQEERQVRALVARGIDGLVLIGEDHTPDTFAFLESRRIPLVLVWSHRPDARRPCVGFDNRRAAAAMAERVLRLGHRRIAMIAGHTAANDRARARVAGVRETLASAGVRLDPPLLVETAYALDPSAAAAAALLARPERPTAIICGNDVLAVGAIRAARDAGLRVPRDVSVVGFDDIDLARVVEPPLTTVHVPHRRMGRAAARRLLDAVATGSAVGSAAFETEIVERGSLGPAPAADPPC